MLITTAFGSSKAAPALRRAASAPSKEDVLLPRPSSLEESTSTTCAQVREEEAVNGTGQPYSSKTSSSTSAVLSPLTTSQATTLNLFLRSSRSIASLQIADIQGVIDPTTGELLHSPAVRKGRVKTASHGSHHSGSIQCCIIEALLFEKCEIVATIVKKNAIYRQVRQQNNNAYAGPSATSSNPSKGKGRLDHDIPTEEQVQLIFYDLDDDSGASITCCVNPSRVYAKELSECRNQQASSASSTSSSDSSHSENESSRSTSSRYASIENETNQTTPRALRGSSDRNKHTIEDEGERKRDPRLWIYRYKSPPRPVPPQTKPTATSSPSFTVPVYKEGTIVRIIGKIFINTSRGNERQIEASSIECLYEPSYIIGRRIYKEKGNKYAEWHHTVNCRKKRLEYKDREKVRELIGFTDGNTGYANQSNSQSMSQDVTMQDDSMIPLNDTINTTTTNTSYIPSTSLLDMSHLTEHTLNRNNSSSDGSQRNNNKRKKVKLPSCSTLYKQKIQITKEIFSLYMHQFFRNLEKMQSDRRDRILPSSFASSSTSVLGVLQSDRAEKSSIGVTLDEIKEDKNLKWLAEIYARNEAKRLAILHQAQDTSTCSEPPKPKKRYFDTDGAESSIINPTSSPAYSTRSTPRPRATAMMVDTTNISSISSASSSSSSTTKTNKKIKVEAGIVDKIRNDLFRNTILKLVKDGIIIVYTADLSTPKPPPLVQLRAKECVVCMKKIEIELEKIPPIMTMEGIPLRELRAKQMKEENCQCPSKARIQSRPSEETYALLTSGMLLPVVERIVSRIDHGNELLVEQVWNAVKGQDDMWRFVSKELVKECMEMV